MDFSIGNKVFFLNFAKELTYIFINNPLKKIFHCKIICHIWKELFK